MMRKEQKAQTEELVRQMREAHSQIGTYLREHNAPAAMELLSVCQESAVELGDFIEKTENNSKTIISLLENYCELVYQWYQEIQDSADKKQEKADLICKSLDDALCETAQSIKKDIQIKYEIVFMPYKASMWDSLESIWRAAKEDASCEVYVVPIPYFDRNPDRTLGLPHYEGKDFPEEADTLFYQSYDIEERRPDIIYIHNPYDERNYVTSVAPQFYSSNLKKYTECLIYVPYCVYEEPADADKESTADDFARYIFPGLLYADKVILQSENFSKAMINALTKYCGMDREYWKSRILGLGSPKYDKAAVCQEDKLPIPDDWIKLIRKPDGSRKKVIFYNTSLGALLLAGKQMLVKIRSVLQCCYEHREECVLLWRPHPLVQATLESLHPELCAEYKQMADTYIEQGWGIYDDTSDFHTAFAVSDVYYGDYSSLVLLYQATGKPLLEQKTHITDYKKRLVTNRFYYDGQYIWGTAWEFNGLFRMDPVTCKAEFMGRFPEERQEEYGLFYSIAECGGKLYFCPYHAKHIGVYDKAAEEFSVILLKEEIRDIEKKFQGILSDGRYIYLPGSRAHTIVRIDAETNETLYIDGWVNMLKEREADPYEYLVLGDGCIYNGSLCFYAPGSHGLLLIGTDHFSCEFISLKNSHTDSFLQVMEADGVLWLSPEKNGFVTGYDVQTSVMTEYVKLEEGTSGLCRVNDSIYAFSKTQPYLYRIHMKTKEVTKIITDAVVYHAVPVGNKIYMTTFLTGELYVFDTDHLKIIKKDLLLDYKNFPQLDEKRVLEKNKNFYQYARETGFMNLETLIKMDWTEASRRTPNKNSGCGKKIHEYVKGIIQ